MSAVEQLLHDVAAGCGRLVEVGGVTSWLPRTLCVHCCWAPLHHGKAWLCTSCSNGRSLDSLLHARSEQP
jgi:hypothetical protein